VRHTSIAYRSCAVRPANLATRRAEPEDTLGTWRVEVSPKRRSNAGPLARRVGPDKRVNEGEARREARCRY
jgi:hypothetical protein